MRCKDYCQVPAIFARIEITDLLIPPPLLTEPDGTVYNILYVPIRHFKSRYARALTYQRRGFAKSRYANSSPDTPIQVPIQYEH